jgi:hypothetical protein
LNSLRQIQPSSKIHLHGSICCNSNNGTEIGGFGWVEEVPGVNAQERSREELLAFTNACGFVTCARNRVGNQCAKRLEWRFLQLPVVQRVVPPVPGEQASAWFWPRRSNSVGMRHAQQLKVVLKKNTCPHEAAAGEWRPRSVLAVLAMVFLSTAGRNGKVAMKALAHAFEQLRASHRTICSKTGSAHGTTKRTTTVAKTIGRSPSAGPIRLPAAMIWRTCTPE